MYKHQTNSPPQTFSYHFVKHSLLIVHYYPAINTKDYSSYKVEKSSLWSSNTNNYPILSNSLDRY